MNTFGGMIPGGVQAAQGPQDPRMGGMIPGGMSGGQAPATLGRGRVGVGYRPPVPPQMGRPYGLGGSVPNQSRPPLPGSRFGHSFQSPHTNPNIALPTAVTQPQAGGGVRPGNNMMGGPSVPSPQGPSLQQIQAEMARRQVGAQLGPRNGALAGYMMG